MFKSTKLNELLASVTERTECWNAELFARQFDLYGNVDYDMFSKRMSYAWLVQWTCTDTCVGIQAYYLDSELVAVSTQIARKANEYVFWVDQSSWYLDSGRICGSNSGRGAWSAKIYCQLINFWRSRTSE